MRQVSCLTTPRGLVRPKNDQFNARRCICWTAAPEGIHADAILTTSVCAGIGQRCSISPLPPGGSLPGSSAAPSRDMRPDQAEDPASVERDLANWQRKRRNSSPAIKVEYCWRCLRIPAAPGFCCPRDRTTGRRRCMPAARGLSCCSRRFYRSARPVQPARAWSVSAAC